MLIKQTKHDARIRVDKQIVNLLSRSTYESFPRVLRELVSNSYDADATKVTVTISLTSNEIQVVDNGNGMSPEQFNYFLTIAGSSRGAKLSPRYKRERIGQFGVGFLAAFPFCNEMVVETISVSSGIVISATIPCSEYLVRQRSGDELNLEPVDDINVSIVETQNPRKYEDHYTIISLRGLTPLAMQYFSLTPSSIVKNSVRDKSPMERLKWDLQDTLVLDYPDKSKIAEALKQPNVGMEVFLNDLRLFRNEPPGHIMKTDIIEINGLSVRYVITSPWKPVHPTELRGLRIRVNNVGVGARETFGLAVQGGGLPRLAWLSGDVYIDKGAREYLALNREGFTNAPVIVELNDILRAALRDVNDSLTDTDTVLKEVESGLGMSVEGGGPRRKSLVGSKRELVEDKVDQLEKAGFKVERIVSSDHTTNNKVFLKTVANNRNMTAGGQPNNISIKSILDPVEIDRQSKIIRIYESHPGFEDTIVTSMGKFKMVFESWDYKNTVFPACQVLGANNVRINKTYPLFKSRSLGQIFLRIAISLTVSSNNSPAKIEFARELLLNWAEEFKNIE